MNADFDEVTGGEQQGFDIWPAFTDLMLSILMIFIFLVAGQLLTTSESIKWKIISLKQAQMEEAFERQVQEYTRKEQVQVITSGSLQRFTFSDELLFESGSSNLLDKGKALLNGVGYTLAENRRLYTQIDVQGHTDSIPISNREYADNWELSSERALSVVRYLQRSFRIDSEKLSGSGFAHHRPVASNADIAGRSRNRRIEIVLVFSGKLSEE
jgi:chemotaxis protein MotB